MVLDPRVVVCTAAVSLCRPPCYPVWDRSLDGAGPLPAWHQPRVNEFIPPADAVLRHLLPLCVNSLASLQTLSSFVDHTAGGEEAVGRVPAAPADATAAEAEPDAAPADANAADACVVAMVACDVATVACDVAVVACDVAMVACDVAVLACDVAVVFAASACVFAVSASVFAVSACVLNVCVSVFICCNSDLYVVETCRPEADNDKLVSASLICNPLPIPAILSTIPPFPFNLINKLGFIKN